MVKPKGDGSPCNRAWRWIEENNFESKEEIYEKYSTELNDYMRECIENYPWPEKKQREVRLDVYLERMQGRKANGQFTRGTVLVEYYHLYTDLATGLRTKLDPTDVIVLTQEHIRARRA